MNESVSVRLMGGLGNQLFQYAAARATSVRLGCPLLLDLQALSTPAEHATRQYMLGAFRTEAHIPQPSQNFSEWEEYREPTFHYDVGFEAIRVGTYLTGYFQSELYFASIGDRIRAELQLAVPTSAAFCSLLARIAEERCAVSVHVRRSDYVTNAETRSFHGVCGAAYYERALSVIKALTGTPTYFVFSDDPEEARAMFVHLRQAVFVDTPPGSPWEDLILMSHCRHHVLANSSFSWWGAWLNPSMEKVVVAPRRWLSVDAMRRLSTADLHPDGTILV